MPFSVALSAAAGAVGSFFATSKVIAFVIKAGILFGASWLLRPKQDKPNFPERTHTETFASGPARWVIGRQKVGGVIMFWGEDWNVRGTERRNEFKGGADDLHLVIGLSEGDLEGIEAVWVGNDRFDVKFHDAEKTRPVRREEDLLDANASDYRDRLRLLPLELDPGVNAHYDEQRDQWRESESVESRVLDRDDEDDAEIIRKAHLGGAVGIFPYLSGTATVERFQSLRRYTDDLQNRLIREGDDLNNEFKELPFADQWTTEHKLQGVACVHVRLRQWVKHNFDHRVFKSGTPNVSFLVKGLRIAYPDPNAETGETVGWTENAAAIRYWWHTERRGIPKTAIDRDSFVQAFKDCEAKIIPDRPSEWPGGVQPEWAKDDSVWGFSKYSINGVLSSGDDPSEIESDFDRQWQGQVVEDGGKLYYYPGVDRAVSGSVSGADVLEYPTVAPAPSLSDRVNAVTMSIRQSSHHDYNSHALAEISDTEKREDVDRDFHLPTDLGEWRWTINPASAYSLALINLRRARFATTISLKLNPGDADDPVKYLTMSPGLVYQIDFPEEGISGRRMALQSKTINADMTVDATFLDSPVGIYEDSYRLPELVPRPPYTPSKAGARPPKPTGLIVRSTARSSSDGSTHFRIVASVDETAFRKIFRLQAGDDSWETTTENASSVFEINVPRQIMEITVRHIDAEGIDSLPVKEIFTPDYSGLVLPTPRWKDAYYHAGTLRMSFEADEFVSGVAGVEVRYTRKDLDDADELDLLDVGTWTISGEPLTTKPVQIVRGQEIVAEALVRESGHYNLFARFVSSVSGSEPVLGPISAAREVAIDIAIDPVDSYEAAPLWDVVYHNLFKWDSKYGNTRGESLMYPAYDPADTAIVPTGLSGSDFILAQADWDRIHYAAGKSAGAVKMVDRGGYSGLVTRATYYARKSSSGSNRYLTLYDDESQALAGGSTGRANPSGSGVVLNVRLGVDLDSIPFDVWNGYVADSSVTADPLARWPFGRAPGFDQALEQTGRNADTGLLQLANPGGSTWMLTPVVDLGSSRRVEVRAEAYAYAPGTDSVSNVTFGGVRIPSQRYKANTAIDAVRMPAAVDSVGSVIYTLVGLPAGLAFDASTREITGTPAVASAQGQATYTATDALGGSVSLDFDWAVSADLTAPGAVQGLRLATNGATPNSLQYRWDTEGTANWYRVEFSKVGGSLQADAWIFGTTFTLTDLDASSTYRLRVRGTNGAGHGPYTAFVQATTSAEIVAPTGAPANLRASSINDRAAIMVWDGQAGASTYELRWKLAADTGYPAGNIKTGLGSTIGQIDPLQPNVSYDVQVRSRNAKGASPWSSARRITATSSLQTVPTVTITTHSSGPNEKRPFFRIVTNRLSGETGTEIRVRILRSFENGGDADLPASYPPAGEGPFLYFNGVGPGGTYLVRVRKVFEPAGGIGLIRYSDWYEETLTFGGVPAQPNPPRNIDNPPKPTEIQFRVTRTATATRYRIRYWTTADPTSILQVTTNDNQVGGAFAYTVTGLQDESTYNFTLEAYNSDGWSIPSEVGTTTLPILYRTPGAIADLKSAPISDASAIFAWTEDPHAESYDLDGSATGVIERVGQTGITGDNFILEGLQPSRRWRVRIRGYNSRAAVKYGPWRSFTPVDTPPTPAEVNPYPMNQSTLTASRNASEPRKIDWTFTCPSAANVIGLQIRYAQNYYGSDGKVTDWTIGYDNIFNITFANDGDTFSGSFDPGYSTRLWEVDVRLLLSDGGTYDGGFTTWRGLSNQTEWRRTPNSPLVTRSNAFANGAKPMTAPTPRISQDDLGAGSSWDGHPRIVIDWAPDTADFESPNATDGSSRNEIRVEYRNRVRPLPWADYPVSTHKNYRPWAGGFQDGNVYTEASRLTFVEIRRLIGIQPYYELNTIEPGETFRVQIVRHEPGRVTVHSPVVEYTVVDPDDAEDIDVNAPVLFPPQYIGRDVKFRWGPVAGATDYQVLLLEDNLYGVTPADDPGVLVQDSAGREWTKAGGLNEHFTIKVRSYRRSYGRIGWYSDYATYHYTPPATEVGKISGLRANVNGDDLELLWNALPGTATDNRYEISTSTDDGATWSGNSNIPIAPWPEGQVEHTIDDAAGTDTLVRIRAYKRVGQEQRVVPSSSWATFRWTPTPTGDDAPDDGDLNPINEIAAAARDGWIHIDWRAPATSDVHPAPTRYRLQQSSAATGPWTNYQSGIAATVDEWDVVANPSVARWFRVRPETFDQDGEWILIPFVPESGVTVGATDVTASSTYTTMTAFWEPAENAQEYELQWKSGTGGFGGASGAASTTTVEHIEGGSYTIGGLLAGTHYQVRVRGVAGSSVGAYSDAVDLNTLDAVAIDSPASVILTPTNHNLLVTWNAVASATGYQIRFDAKQATATDWISDVLVKNVSTTTINVAKTEFPTSIAYANSDIRCRVKSLFQDSPSTNYSAYVTIRWAQGPYVTVPSSSLDIVNPFAGQITAANPYIVHGVNGTMNFGVLLSAHSSTGYDHIVRYIASTPGVYVFTIKTFANQEFDVFDGVSLSSVNKIGGAVGAVAQSGYVATVSGRLDPGAYTIAIRQRDLTGPSTGVLEIFGPAPTSTALQYLSNFLSLSVPPGQSFLFSFHLDKPPASALAVVPTVTGTGLSVSPSTVSFSKTNWYVTQSVTVSVAADTTSSRDYGWLTLTGSPGNVVRSFRIHTVNIGFDIQSPILRSSLNTGRGVRIRLNSEPTADVTVSIAVNNPQDSDGDRSTSTVTHSSLTFTSSNWNVYQTLTVNFNSTTSAKTLRFTLKITASGGGYGEVEETLSASVIKDALSWPQVRINGTDYGTGASAPVVPTIDIVEGEFIEFTVKFIHALGETTTQHYYNISTKTPSASSPLSVSPARLNIEPNTNPITDRTFTLTATAKENTVSDGVIQAEEIVLHDVDANRTSGIVFNVFDNDVPNFMYPRRIDKADLVEGGSTTFDLRLTKRPNSPVIVSLTSSNSDITVSPATLVFESSTYKTLQSITVSAAHDNDGFDDVANIYLTATGGGYNSVNGVINVFVDDDDPTHVLTAVNGITFFNYRLSDFGDSSAKPALTATGTIDFPISLWHLNSFTDYITNYTAKRFNIWWNITIAATYKLKISLTDPPAGYVLTGFDIWTASATVTDWSLVRFTNILDFGSTHWTFEVQTRTADIGKTLVVRFFYFDNSNRSLTVYPDATPLRLEILSVDRGSSASATSEASEVAAQAVALGTPEGTAERIDLSTETYAHIEQPRLNPAALPTWFGDFPERCWTTGEAIEEWRLPPAGNGLPPYTIEASGLPAGVAYEAETRTLSGTPTDAAPIGGYATFVLTDAAGNTDTRTMGWVVAVATPAAWNQFGGGFGQIDNPFQMACATKGNARGFFFIPGGTNAQDIEDDAGNARSRVLWLTCPTTHGHRARLLGAKQGDVDYDIVVKVGDDFYFSDTDADTEFVSVPGHADGALIGIYRYEETTTTSGVNNTGDPLVLEWFPEIEHLPAEAGAGGLSASASAERGANADGSTPGESETDIYVLHRNATSGYWTKVSAPIDGWTDIGGPARQIRYELHLRKWENRALRRFTSYHRDKE